MADAIEKTLFAAADKMRGAMDPGEYKHVALGLIFLRYVSAAFEAKREEFAKDDFIDLEDPEEMRRGERLLGSGEGPLVTLGLNRKGKRNRRAG